MQRHQMRSGTPWAAASIRNRTRTMAMGEEDKGKLQTGNSPGNSISEPGDDLMRRGRERRGKGQCRAQNEAGLECKIVPIIFAPRFNDRKR